MSIVLRGIVDELDVVEGKLQTPDEPNDGATFADVASYQTAQSRYQKADCNAMIILSTNMSEETYEKAKQRASAREVWLELHRLFDGVHEDRAYDLCMKFRSYKMTNGDDCASHVGKLRIFGKSCQMSLRRKKIRTCS